MAFGNPTKRGHRGILVATLGCTVLAVGIARNLLPKTPNPALATVQYAVYADYLSAVAKEPWAKSSSYVQHGVVLRQSALPSKSGALDEFFQKNLKDMQSSAWKDFVAQNNAESKGGDLHDVYVPLGDLQDPGKACRRLQQQEPFEPNHINDYALQVYVSRIGLNRDSTQAVFHAYLISGLCGSRQFIVMQRRVNEWQIQNVSTFPMACF